MSRRGPKNSFDLSRDVLADAPSSIEPGAKLPPLETLPPLPAAGGDATKSASPATERTEVMHDQVRAPSQPRGTGGRPTVTRASKADAGEPTMLRKTPSSMTRIAVRVPGDLYDRALPLVKGIGRPSWGQLVSWTCADHHADVVSSIVANVVPASRRPRGQGVVGTAGNQVTARLFPDEVAPIDAVTEDVKRQVEQKITRTMVVLAALEIATTTTAARQERLDASTPG